MSLTSWICKPVQWLASHKQRVAQFGLGIVMFETMNHAYDFGFFPFAIGVWGYVWGAVIVTAGALLLNACVYFAYDVMKIDWLQAHANRELADKENKTAFEKLITWHRKEDKALWEKVLAPFYFASLTLALDPVIIAMYYRKNYFKGISLRDWGMLVLSTVVACGMWLLWEPLIFVLKLAYHAIRALL